MGLKRATTSYSFKSVGEINLDYLSRKQETKKTSANLGIKTPLELDDDNFLKMHSDGNLKSQIADNLRNLILTNKGERLGNYEFGGDLRPLLFELGEESGDKKAMGRIAAAVAKYMPYISLSGFEIENLTSPDDYASAIGKLIKITYSIPVLKTNELFGVQLVLYFGE